jgi:hypothetical protein
MNTKMLMILSALVTGLTGICLLFLPKELAGLLEPMPSAVLVLILQTLGALYFGFAILNWMSKGNLIGGIYSRPVTLANITHFFIGAMTFIKAAPSHSSNYLWVIAAVYSLFALTFIYVMYTHPVKVRI